MSKQTARIKDYFYYMSEIEGVLLCGEVHGHPIVEDGHHVVTSTVLFSAFDKEQKTIETRNTYYQAESPLAELTEYWKNKLKQLRMAEDKVVFV